MASSHASEQPRGADWEDITVSGGKVLGEESDVSRTARLVKAKLRMGRGDGEADSGQAIRGQLSRAANAHKGLLLFPP